MLPLEFAKPRVNPGNHQLPGSKDVVRLEGSSLRAHSLADELFLVRMSSGFIGRKKKYILQTINPATRLQIPKAENNKSKRHKYLHLGLEREEK